MAGMTTEVTPLAATVKLDDQPAKVYRVGSTVIDNLVLQALNGDNPRAVSLGYRSDGPAIVSLELPPVRAIAAASTAAPAVLTPNPGVVPAPPPPGPAPVPPPAVGAPNMDHSTGVLRD